MEAPTCYWKSNLGVAFFLMSFTFWIAIGFKKFVLGPLPHTFEEENREMQLRRQLDLKYGIIRGQASRWDYENDCWK